MTFIPLRLSEQNKQKAWAYTCFESTSFLRSCDSWHDTSSQL